MQCAGLCIRTVHLSVRCEVRLPGRGREDAVWAGAGCEHGERAQGAPHQDQGHQAGQGEERGRGGPGSGGAAAGLLRGGGGGPHLPLPQPPPHRQEGQGGGGGLAGERDVSFHILILYILGALTFV